MHIGLKSKIKHTEESAIKQTKNYIETKRTTGIVAHSSTLSAHQTAVFAICAGANLQDTMPINEGAGCAAAIPAYQGTKAIAKAAHAMLKAVGQMFMLKTLPIAVVTNILGTGWAMAAAGNRAENPSKLIINKKTNDVKGYFIPIAYKKYIEHAMQEIEYQKFLQRNRDLISSDMDEADDTLLDGLDDRD